MPDDPVTNPGIVVKHAAEGTPPWVYIIALMLGVPLAGGGGSLLGASQASADLQRLEVKLEQLDDKLDALTLAIARAHPDMQMGR
jgi:outer membrane murein-binding lipoprotein Lpp